MVDYKSQRVIDSLRWVLEVREKELRDRLGPCSHSACRLHSAHNGPCDVPPQHAKPEHIIKEQP